MKRPATRRAALLALAAAALAGPGALCAVAAHPQIPVGGFPTGIALDPATHTIYVGNGTSAELSLIDGAACNARRALGCRHHVSAATGGIDPVGIGIDESNGTVYVVNAFGTLAVVNGRRCNAGDSSGCKVKPATVPLGTRPQFLAVDGRTHTIYVANVGSNTISVVDGRRCNARTTAGCRRPGIDVPLGPAPFTLALNEATNSLYVTVLGAPTVSILDLRDCRAAELRGCLKPPVTIDVGETPGGIAINRRTNTIYVTGQVSNDVSVIDGNTCNAHVTRGCHKRPARFAAGRGARGIAVNEATDTVYVANTAANTVSVIDGATCNGTVHRGCGRGITAAPVGASPRRVAVDERTNTVYVTNAGSNTVTVLNGATCNGRVHRGCGKVPSPDVK
jgi:DNA-binding beta-propeller fold protein YncE